MAFNPDISTALKELTDKLDTLLSYMRENHELEKRVRSIEDWKSNLQGKVVVLVIIGGGIWSLAVAAIVMMMRK